MRGGVVLVLAAALAVAGCGGSGGGKRLTKDDFIERGDAICAKYRAKNEALNKEAPARNPTDPQATDDQVRKTGPILEKLAGNVRSGRDELADLKPPTDVESDWKNTLDDLGQIADKLHDAAVAAVELNRQRVVNDYSEILRINRRISSFESDYGFRVCGQSG